MADSACNNRYLAMGEGPWTSKGAFYAGWLSRAGRGLQGRRVGPLNAGGRLVDNSTREEAVTEPCHRSWSLYLSSVRSAHTHTHM